jgi:hypothetical protein
MSAAENETTHETSEQNQSLWLLTVSPLIWAAHFLLSYLTAAIYCAKHAGPNGSLGGVRLAILAYTVMALSGIAFTGWTGFRRHDYGIGPATHDFDTPADRHRFLGFATLLLSGLSAVAVAFVAMVAWHMEDCR